jgi:8-oxo-dGTP diphosphatase
MKEHSAILIKNNNNEILFIKRSMNKKILPGAWSFPSGTVEEGEHIYDTTIREAMEELDLEIEIKDILATRELPEFSVRLIFVLCSIKNREPIIKEPQEIDKIKWMKFSDFFNKFSDDEIGHGLIWLRQNPKIWEKYN